VQCRNSESSCWVNSTFASYLWGPWLKSQPRDLLPWQMFVDALLHAIRNCIDTFFSSRICLRRFPARSLYNSLVITRPFLCNGMWSVLLRGEGGREGSVAHIAGCSNAETGSCILQTVVTWQQLPPLLWPPQENNGKLLRNASLTWFVLKFSEKGLSFLSQIFVTHLCVIIILTYLNAYIRTYIYTYILT